MVPFHYLFAAALGFLWILVSRFVTVRPHPAILRDRIRLSLSYVDDAFLCFSIVRTLFITDILFICVRVTSGGRSYHSLFGLEVHWVYLVCSFLFVHVAAYLAFIYAARTVFHRELNRLAQVMQRYEPLIPSGAQLTAAQWDHLNRVLARQKFYFTRALLSAIAIFVFLSTFMYYVRLLKLFTF